LNAYANGIFPMAEERDDANIYWIDPDFRGVIPLDTFRVSRRLARTVRSDKFSVTADLCFEQVIRACAAPQEGRRTTWINDEIIHLYTELHRAGFVHSIETWRNSELVGGLYGVSLGAAFFGESMFSTVRDASKVALVHLVARLKYGDFLLLDAQFITEHLKQFGAIEIPRDQYRAHLETALKSQGDFYSFSGLGSKLGGETSPPASAGSDGVAKGLDSSGSRILGAASSPNDGGASIELGSTTSARGASTVSGSIVMQSINQTS